LPEQIFDRVFDEIRIAVIDEAFGGRFIILPVRNAG